MEYTRTTYVQFLFHAGQLDEEVSQDRQVASRDIEQLDIPNGAFGFRFVDILESEIEVAGETINLTGPPMDLSSTYYYGGTIMDEEDVRQSEPAEALAYMRLNGYTRVIKTSKGILMPFNDGDIRLEPPETAS